MNLSWIIIFPLWRVCVWRSISITQESNSAGTEIKGDRPLALVGETQLRERMEHGAKWDDNTPRKGWCHMVAFPGTQRGRPCCTTETYRFECGVSWLYIPSPPPSFSSPPSSPPSQPSSPPSLPPRAPPPTLHGLRGTHLYSWIPLEGWRLGLRAVSALKPSWTDNTNSFHFVPLLPSVLVYSFIHSTRAQSLLGTRHYARDTLMSKTHFPEPLVKFFCYYLCCT